VSLRVLQIPCTNFIVVLVNGNIMIYDLYEIVIFAVLPSIFEKANKWLVMLSWLYVAIVVFLSLILVYERFFYMPMKKIKDIRNKHVVVSIV